MALTSKTDYITKKRTEFNKLIDTLNALVNLDREFVAMGYGNGSAFIDGDFIGANAGITAAIFKDAVLACRELNVAVTAGGAISANIDKKIYKAK